MNKSNNYDITYLTKACYYILLIYFYCLISATEYLIIFNYGKMLQISIDKNQLNIILSI